MAVGVKTGMVAVAICSQAEAERILHELSGGNADLYMISSNTSRGYYLVGTTEAASAFWDRYHTVRKARATAGRMPDSWWSQVYNTDGIPEPPQPDQGPRYYHVAAGPDAVRPILVALRQTADSKGWAVCGLAMAPMPDGTVWVGALGAEAVLGLRDGLESLLGVSNMPPHFRTLPNGGHLNGTNPQGLQVSPPAPREPGPGQQTSPRMPTGRFAGRLQLPPAAQRVAGRLLALRERFGRRQGDA